MRTSPWWLLLLAVIAYGGSLFGTLSWMTSPFLDPVLTSPSGWWEVWRPGQTRPLTYFTFWANYMIAGREAAAYHAVNLALHLHGMACVRGAPALDACPDRMVRGGDFRGTSHTVRSGELYLCPQHPADGLFCLLSLNDWLRGTHWRAVLWFAVALLAKEEAVGFAVFHQVAPFVHLA